jgi:hypothetical protein
MPQYNFQKVLGDFLTGCREQKTNASIHVTNNLMAIIGSFDLDNSGELLREELSRKEVKEFYDHTLAFETYIDLLKRFPEFAKRELTRDEFQHGKESIIKYVEHNYERLTEELYPVNVLKGEF